MAYEVAKSVINEQSTCYVEVVFYDRGGTPAAPGTVTYWLHDKASGSAIVDGSVVSAAATVLFTMGTAENAILNSNLKEEYRILNYKGDYGSNDAHRGRYVYRVRNLLVP